MADNPKAFCPECDEQVAQPEGLDRRDFLRTVSGQAAVAALSAGGLVAATPRLLADAPTPTADRVPRPAEALVRELYSGLSFEQRQQVVLPWNHGAGPGRTATRLRMYNGPINQRIGAVFTPSQRELIDRILRAISADDNGHRQLTRNGNFEAGGAMQGCGVNFFGNPLADGPFAWVFAGHHLTVRVDGNSAPDAAFGGPIFYGHGEHGYSPRNLFFYQTRAVLSVFEALSERQRQQAVISGSPGENEPSVRFRPAGQTRPGINSGDLSPDQRRLVEQVMRSVLSPFRQEDADEVMQLIRRNGGLERINLAFYEDRRVRDGQRWHFWRLEGPGFVWNYRVLPHVHTYVNIAGART
jgi:hypothetical protein